MRKHPYQQAILISLVSLSIGILVFQRHGVMIGRGENQSDHRVEVGIWTAQTTLEQTFVASHDRLCRIDFFISSYYPWMSPYLECRLFEIDTREIPSDLPYETIKGRLQEVRSQRINRWLISMHSFNSFRFAPIPDSAQKRYLLVLQSPGLRPGGLVIVRASPLEKAHEPGNLFVNGTVQPGDLAFRAMYRQSWRQVLSGSFARMARYKPAPFSSPVAYSVVFGMYMIMLIVLCVLLYNNSGK